MTHQRQFSSHESDRLARLKRRSITVPVILLSFLIGLGLYIPTVLLAAIVDLCRGKPLPTVRLLTYGLWWLGIESGGILRATFLWLRFIPRQKLTSDDSLKAHSNLQYWWTSNLIRGAKSLLGVRFKLDGQEFLEVGGPLVVLARHGSQGDALLVAAVLAEAGLRPRFIVKRQLLWDPCLDIVGHRIPNYFVDRDAADNRIEIQNIGALARGLEPDEAIVIFPEGTRFSPSKLKRAIEMLSVTAPERVESAQRLSCVLPVRAPGFLSILENNQDADVILLNHVGVTDFKNLHDLWNNIPFPAPLHFNTERLSRSELPPISQPETLIENIDQLWEKFDLWVLSNQK